MKRFIYLLICCFMFLPMLTKALCSDQRDRLQQFANNVSYVLEDHYEGDMVYFNAIFTGMTNDIYILNENTLWPMLYINSTNYIGEVSSDRLRPGRTYRFTIYGNGECRDERFRNITINTPYYNKYYSDPICEKAKNYTLCQKWSKNTLTYEQFLSKVNDYIKENAPKEEEKPVTESGGFDFYTFYRKYYWPTLLTFIGIFIILVILWIKQNNKNKL